VNIVLNFRFLQYVGNILSSSTSFDSSRKIQLPGVRCLTAKFVSACTESAQFKPRERASTSVRLPVSIINHNCSLLGTLLPASLIYGAGQSVESLSSCVNTLKEKLIVNVAPSTSYECDALRNEDVKNGVNMSGQESK
jgi:hypothetical protein